MNGGVGRGGFNFEVTSGAAAGASAAGAVCDRPSDFTYVTSCQRCRSGRFANDGIPLFFSPFAINQNSSPSLTDSKTPSTSAGILPEPSAFRPWQRAQRCA